MAKATFLLVEDNTIQASFIKEFLEKNWYGVMPAEDGMSALKAAKIERLDMSLFYRILPDQRRERHASSLKKPLWPVLQKGMNNGIVNAFPLRRLVNHE
jgi:DNA-binding response OmpR family regulator